jgi:glycosyltransferase involved in cell wall biosynthesis
MSVQDKYLRLSVLLVTFNHEKYIRQSLRSLFGQVFDGPIELVIADDESSDNTLGIIREYEEKDSRFHFKYLDSTRNLGITRNYQRGFGACSGEYVAVLEGDDYWVNPLKLRRQCDFLDAHWECDLCSVNYFVYEEDRAQFTVRVPIGNGYRFIGTRDLIADNLVGNFSTCLYRKSALDALPKNLFDIKSYDWIVNICVARRSLIGLLEEPMSVYRLHSAGVWAHVAPIEKLKIQLDLIPVYDELTGYTFHADFEMLTKRLRDAMARQTILNHVPSVIAKCARAILPSRLKRRLVCMLYGVDR